MCAIGCTPDAVGAAPERAARVCDTTGATMVSQMAAIASHAERFPMLRVRIKCSPLADHWPAEVFHAASRHVL